MADLLHVRNLQTFYSRSQALFDVDLTIAGGEVVALVGRNGVGKTTTVLSIMGVQPAAGGVLTFEGEDLRRMPAYRRTACGIAVVPEGRQIFPNLSVQENLLIGQRAAAGSDGWTIARVLELFPRLGDRLRNRGEQLSGGEQQMLAIGRALMTNPRLLILDEATEGLAPLIRREIWLVLLQLKALGLSMLLIDKYLVALSRIADRAVILSKGRTVWTGGMRSWRPARPHNCIWRSDDRTAVGDPKSADRRGRRRHSPTERLHA